MQTENPKSPGDDDDTVKPLPKDASATGIEHETDSGSEDGKADARPGPGDVPAPAPAISTPVTPATQMDSNGAFEPVVDLAASDSKLTTEPAAADLFSPFERPSSAKPGPEQTASPSPFSDGATISQQAAPVTGQVHQFEPRAERAGESHGDGLGNCIAVNHDRVTVDRRIGGYEFLIVAGNREVR